MKRVANGILLLQLTIATTVSAYTLPDPTEHTFALRPDCFQYDLSQSFKAITSGTVCTKKNAEPTIRLYTSYAPTSTETYSCPATTASFPKAGVTPKFGQPKSDTAVEDIPLFQKALPFTGTPKFFPLTIDNAKEQTWCAPHYELDGYLYYALQSNCIFLEGDTTIRHLGVRVNANVSGKPRLCALDTVQESTAFIHVGVGDLSLSQVWLSNGGIGMHDPKTVLQLRPITHFDTGSRTFTLSEAIIDIVGKQEDEPKYGLVLPIEGLKTVNIGKVIFGFDPTKPHHPIAYTDTTGAIVPSPVPSPTNVMLTRNGSTLTLSGSVPSDIVRIEAFRPAHKDGFDYINQYASKDGKSLDWLALATDGNFVAWQRPDATIGVTTFSIPGLPVYKKSYLSNCEWKNCSNAASGACVFGRGYVVIGYDSESRPSAIVMTNSYGDAAPDFVTIRTACDLFDPKTPPVVLTDQSCLTHEHLVDELCEAVNCAAHQIAKNHQCLPCGINEYVQSNQCLPLQCPAGQQLKDGECLPVICGPGQILKGTACVCDTANGYAAKDFTSNACVKVTGPTKKEKKEKKEKEKKDKKDKPAENSTEQKPAPQSAAPNTNYVTPDTLDSPSPCGPGLQRYGTFCVATPLPSAQIPAPTPSAQPSGGCSLIF